MKYLRRQNLNSNNVLDDTVLQRTDGNIEFNPKDTAYVNGNIEINGTLSFGTEGAGGNLIVGDIAVNGGDLTTDQTTFNLVNTTATTVNFAGAATDIQIGATTGTTTVNNNLDVSGNLTPSDNNTQDLGTTDNKWKAVYATKFVGEIYGGTY